MLGRVSRKDAASNHFGRKAVRVGGAALRSVEERPSQQACPVLPLGVSHGGGSRLTVERAFFIFGGEDWMPKRAKGNDDDVAEVHIVLHPELN